MEFADARAAVIHGAGMSGLILVPYAMFFDGNADDDSIWCNVVDLPYELTHARTIFEKVAARPEVESVWIGLGDWSRDRPEWPFAQEAVVITDAAPEVVGTWFEPYTEMVVQSYEDELRSVPLDQTPPCGVTLSWG